MESQMRADVGEMDEWDASRFVLPPFSLQGGVQKARQLFGGDGELNAMLASLNAAVFIEPKTRAHEPEQPTAH